MSDLQQRRVKSAMEIWKEGGTANHATFQHSVLCQSYFPYRDPGDNVTLYEHLQGKVGLTIQCLKEKNPVTGEYVYLGLPFGTRSRLVMIYLNSEAVRNQSPVIDVERSITSFVRQVGLPSNGQNIRDIKNQLSRIVGSVITLNWFDEPNHSVNVRFALVKKYDLWFPKDENQTVIWSNHIQLTEEYFNQLINHAIPLDTRALRSLKNSPMGLDVYMWLSQRLHRIDPRKPQFVSWMNLKEQFGRSYASVAKFKQSFRNTLQIVRTQYPDSKIMEDKNKGFYLYNSPSPVVRKSQIVVNKHVGQ